MTPYRTYSAFFSAGIIENTRFCSPNFKWVWKPTRLSRAWFASRYDKGTADYVNCAMEKEEYLAFWRELCAAQEAEVHGFEDKNVFEGCMPVEVMARRGEDTLRYGPLKPRGLRDPSTGREPYAGVQLRTEIYKLSAPSAVSLGKSTGAFPSSLLASSTAARNPEPGGVRTPCGTGR